MKHTKGPWIYNLQDNMTEEECANVRLISAAPEMLEALEECLNHLNYAEERSSREFAEEVKVLIKKAKGE
jgi:hypothetical protein